MSGTWLDRAKAYEAPKGGDTQAAMRDLAGALGELAAKVDALEAAAKVEPVEVEGEEPKAKRGKAVE